MKSVIDEYQVRCDNCGKFATRVVNHTESSVSTACDHCDYWMARNLLTACVIESFTNFVLDPRPSSVLVQCTNSASSMAFQVA
jgi:predicted nucleic acid-binding Zn ribbon protein